LGMPSVGVLLLDQSPEHRRGADAASFQIGDVTGSALCVGVVGVLVAASTGGVLPLRAAVFGAVVLVAALAALGAVLAPRAGAPAADRAAEPELSGAAATLGAS
ncbi:MAG TPA: MFS transporter, partial [Blastococcus sp.]|nr:MFS transporter [Blastococcus sp.]